LKGIIVRNGVFSDCSLPREARRLIECVSAIGSTIAISALFQWHRSGLSSLAVWALVAVIAGAVKFRIPGIESSYSLGYLVVLGAVGLLRFPEAIAVSIVTVVVQCYCGTRYRPRPVQVVFNTLNYVISAAGAWYTFHGLGRLFPALDINARFVIASGLFFVINTALVSAIVASLSQRKLADVWKNSFLLILPYYFVGVASAAVLRWKNDVSTWIMILVVLASVYASMRAWGRQKFVDYP
jgi:hypothetical protein